jgi:hypothetical protein
MRTNAMNITHPAIDKPICVQISLRVMRRRGVAALLTVHSSGEREKIATRQVDARRNYSTSSVKASKNAIGYRHYNKIADCQKRRTRDVTRDRATNTVCGLQHRKQGATGCTADELPVRAATVSWVVHRTRCDP